MDSNYCSWGDGAGAGRDREEAGYFSEELRSEVAWVDTYFLVRIEVLGQESSAFSKQQFLCLM